MNNVSLIELEKQKEEKLKKYKLDSESILELKAKIKQKNEEESNELGKQLIELVSKKKTDTLLDKITELIYNGANIEYKSEPKGDFPLLVCIRKGYVEEAFLLLRVGANVNQTNNYLTTPLMTAARHGHSDLVELLILLGADVNAKCLDGDTAIMSAKRHSKQECFDILLKNQAYFNIRNLANDTVFNLDGTINFDNVESVINNEEVTEEDTNNLINEAIESMKLI